MNFCRSPNAAIKTRSPREICKSLSCTRFPEFILPIRTRRTEKAKIHFFSFSYQLDASRLKCLRTWHEYTVTKRIQEERKSLADEHRRLTKLKGGFQKWKKRVGLWFCKALDSSFLEELVAI